MKNWVVISKPVKEKARGLAKYLNYLTNQNHKNHIGKTKIIPLFGNENNLYKRVVYSVAEKELSVANKRKGGRPISSFAQSFVFTLPEELGVNPTKAEWSFIAKELINTLVYFTGVSKEDLAKNIFINIHDQNNPHLNLVISKVINGDVKNDLQKKTVINSLKKAFNLAVFRRFKITPLDYKPKTNRRKRYNSDYFKKNQDFLNQISRVNHPDPKLVFHQVPTSNSNKMKTVVGRRFE